MPSTHQDQELDQLRDRVERLETLVTAARAVVNHGQPDYRARCDAAASALRRLLQLPDRRPASWEAAPVSKLADELRGILGQLTGGAL